MHACMHIHTFTHPHMHFVNTCKHTNNVYSVSPSPTLYVFTHANTYMYACTCVYAHTLTHTHDETHVNTHTMCVQCHLPVYLCVEKIQLTLVECRGTHYRDEVSLNCHRVAKNSFIEVVGRWLSHEDGTGDSPHTWETVFTKKKLLSLLKGIWQKDIRIVKCYAVVSSHMYIRVHTHTSMTSTDICMACYIVHKCLLSCVHMYSD